MFVKIALISSALVAGVSAAPLPRRSQPLDNWNSLPSMSNFDSFYGQDNYSGHLKQVNLVPEQNLVCQKQQIEIVQQRLLVLKEYAKKIVTELICEVETQTFVWEQWQGSAGHFAKDLKRESNFEVGYDAKIVEHLPKLWDDKYENFGFTGNDYGSNYVVPSGHNWVPETSKQSVGDAFLVAEKLKVEIPSFVHQPPAVPTHIPPPQEHVPPPVFTSVSPPVFTSEHVPPPVFTSEHVPPPVFTTEHVPPPVHTTTSEHVPPPAHTTTSEHVPPPVHTPPPVEHIPPPPPPPVEHVTTTSEHVPPPVETPPPAEHVPAPPAEHIPPPPAEHIPPPPPAEHVPAPPAEHVTPPAGW